MNSIENAECTSTRPALALVAKNSRTVLRNNLKVKIEKGEVRAVRLIPTQDAGGLKQVRRELIKIVSIGGGDWQKNWTIQECFA